MRDERDHPVRRRTDQPEPSGRDDAQRALAPAQQRRQVVAGVVLHEPAHAPHHVARAEHGFDADELLARAAEADEVDAAGVGRDRPTDGGTAPRAEVDGVPQTDGSRGALHRLDGRARAGDHLLRQRVDRVDGVEAAQAHHQLAGQRHTTADHAGVATLRHERDLLAPAQLDESRPPPATEPGRTTAGVAPRKRPVQSTSYDAFASGSTSTCAGDTMSRNSVDDGRVHAGTVRWRVRRRRMRAAGRRGRQRSADRLGVWSAPRPTP